MAHVPVLLEECMELLAVKPGGLYVDGTLGPGGHAAEVLRRSAPEGRLLGVDTDGESLAQARESLAAFGSRARFAQADFREVPALLAGARADGILLDLGISSLQLDAPERGFSFQAAGPLDMRMDRTGGETAADVVNRAREHDLADVIYRYGEEPGSRRIARAIVRARARGPIRTTTELAEIVRRAAPRRRPGLDAATRTFQALRIRVNRELERLAPALRALGDCLAPGGRLVVVAFHSLEDREVKQAFRELARGGFRLLTKKPLRPREEEVRRNPRARSARLRAVAREAPRPDREAV
ncbi:MAG TPA: 16S rRNA (cytosine(1402)-N(4))-methyltransferase RsmH [Vicinamibacteria bacterium]|nr:16S rRNA (cytosine(1402)-N(4))-methyltransferase RsmH [Vicinamibacteria bacterium]